MTNLQPKWKVAEMDTRLKKSFKLSSLLKSRKGGSSGKSDLDPLSHLTAEKRDLILKFRTITSLIYILQTSEQRESNLDLDKNYDHDPDRSRDLRVLTSLSVLIVRKDEVTAVVSNDPRRCDVGEELQVVATRPEKLHHPTSANGPDLRRRNFFALRNPHSDHTMPVLSLDLNKDRVFGVLATSMDHFDMSTPLDSVFKIRWVQSPAKLNAVH